jgi:hypothetical protein
VMDEIRSREIGMVTEVVIPDRFGKGSCPVMQWGMASGGQRAYPSNDLHHCYDVMCWVSTPRCREHGPCHARHTPLSRRRGGIRTRC